MSILLSSSLTILKETLQGEDESSIEFRVVESQRIHIDRIWTTHSDRKKDHRGLGTALFRQVMERAVQQNLAVSATASWRSKSHLFYLKMGMVPDDFPLSYVILKYGKKGYEALNDLKTSTPTLEQFEFLDQMLTQEKNQPEPPWDPAFLISLLDKTSSFRTDYFIPALFKFLQTADSSDRFLDSRELGSINLQMSAAGRAQWQTAIDCQIPFIPFRKYEHLFPYMTEEQKKERMQWV